MQAIKAQTGYVLIDAMAAFFVFAMGAVTVLQLQASMMAQNQLAQMRTQASLQASQLISVASLDVGNANCYVIPVDSQVGCGSEIARGFTNAWLTDTQAKLPGSATVLPAATLNANGTLSVTVSWKLKSESNYHNLNVIGQVQ